MVHKSIEELHKMIRIHTCYEVSTVSLILSLPLAPVLRVEKSVGTRLQSFICFFVRFKFIECCSSVRVYSLPMQAYIISQSVHSASHVHFPPYHFLHSTTMAVIPLSNLYWPLTFSNCLQLTIYS